MDSILSFDKVALFIAFFMPGFVMLKVYELFVPADERDFTKAFPSVVSYSVLHYALTAWPAFILKPPGLWVYAYLDVLVIPILWPVLIVTIRETHGDFSAFFDARCLAVLARLYKDVFTTRALPTPWDSMFRDNSQWLWIRARLKGGGWVGGQMVYGSVSSIYPRAREVYVREAWILDAEGKFVKRRAGTRGIWIDGAEVVALELSRGVDKTVEADGESTR